MAKGYLVIIGGAEDKEGDSKILKHVADMIYDEEVLTILTTATELPEETGSNYREVFSRLGVKNINVLNINTRESANNKKNCNLLKESVAVFFTGGDQLRITSILGGTQA